MIRNLPLFIISLLCIVIALALRRISGVEDLGIPTILTDFRVWVGIAIASGVASILRIDRKSSVAPPPRDRFQPIPTDGISAQVEKWARELEPDIPMIVDYIIYQAIQTNASDIHFDPAGNGMHIRYRVQGLIKPVTTIPQSLSGKVVNRLKILSNLVIYKDVLPQDGRFDRNTEQETEPVEPSELKRSGLHGTDFRIAFMPTLHGERIVIRILGHKNDTLTLTGLGMDASDLATMCRLLCQPQGMLILTGPTGSGKTTTIFAAIEELLRLSDRSRSVSTLEDPIETVISGIHQSQVNEERDFTFEKGLRAILRQDPDVILVGEIRDAETARIAIQAGMTGHLMITTVHAGSSAAAFSRLQEMGIPPYSLISSITAVLGQRLLRTLCPHCRMEAPPAPDTVSFPTFQSVGCPECDNTGYRGRTAVFEILEVTEPIRSLISASACADEIYREARRTGMRTLWEASLERVREGSTTLEEITRNVSSPMK